MCGISALIALPKATFEDGVLKKMTQIIAHRGPDGEGYYIDNQEFGLGHRRLSIIDTSSDGIQPMFSADSNLVIVFNGEIYNYIEIRSVLEEKGIVFKTKTDTEVILAAYAYWGEDCLQQFNGMWAFVLYDKVKNQLFCSRDRFGVKPLYYGRVGECFALASEIKQFTVLPTWQARLNLVRAYEFLAEDYKEHTEETFFETIFEVPAAHYLIYNLKKHSFDLKKYYYFEKHLSPKQFLPPFKAIEKFGMLLKDAVRLRLRSDVPVGMTLSGGLDSSAIAGYVAEIEPNSTKKTQYPTFSSCHINFKEDESVYIDAVIARHGFPNDKIDSTFEQVLACFDSVTWHQDGPVNNTSLLTHFRLMQAIREQGIKVVLAGQGADEILAGYQKFYAYYFKALFQNAPIQAIKSIFYFIYLHPKEFFSVLKSVKKRISFFQKKDKNTPTWWNTAHEVEATKKYQRPVERTIQESSLASIYAFGLQRILHHEDRNSMALGIEARSPFLDYRLMEFCLALPDELKIHNAKRKYILREATKHLLPKKIYTRYDKLGFPSPQEDWLKANTSWLKENLEESLTSLQGLIQPSILDELKKRNPNYRLLWRIIALARFVRVFDVKIC